MIKKLSPREGFNIQEKLIITLTYLLNHVTTLPCNDLTLMASTTERNEGNKNFIPCTGSNHQGKQFFECAVHLLHLQTAEEHKGTPL